MKNKEAEKVKDSEISLPQTFTCTMSSLEASKRKRVAELFKGVRFTKGISESGKILGTTTVTDLEDLDAFNNLLESLQTS